MSSKLGLYLRILLFSASLQMTSASKAEGYTLALHNVGLGKIVRDVTNSAYSEGSLVTLSAIPDIGWAFSLWSGDESGSANPLQVTMTSNKSVTATFVSAWFVDSVSGDDANPGSYTRPLKSLKALVALTGLAGAQPANIWLKRGSVFREQFHLPDNCTVRAYGQGLNPIVSGADALSSGALAPVAGLSKTFSIPVSPALDVGFVSNSNVLMVWENSRRLRGGGIIYGDVENGVTGIDQVEATAGSWWYDRPNRMLYIHPFDNADPRTNGVQFEVSTRTLALWGGTNTLVEDLVAEKAWVVDSTGSQGYAIFGNADNTYLRCVGRHSWNHAIGVANQTTGDMICGSCIAYDCATDLAAPATLFVFYKGGAASGKALWTNCWAIQPYYQTSNAVHGFYAHDDTGLNPGKIRVTMGDCGAQNCFYGWRGDATIGMSYVSGSSWYGISNSFGLSLGPGQSNLVLRTISRDSSVINHTTATIIDSLFSDCGITGEGGSLTVVSNSVFSARYRPYGALLFAPAATAHVWSNVFYGTGWAYEGSGASHITEADHNVYYALKSGLAKSAPSTYGSLASWRGSFPNLDASSTEALPTLPSASTNLQFVIPAFQTPSLSAESPEVFLKSKEGKLSLSFEARKQLVYSVQQSQNLIKWVDAFLVGPLASDTTVVEPIRTALSREFFRVSMP